ncbi:envelope membrane protein [Crinalium epipsammum PCC 9333]|uniref:Proton extrusion protein PxcA n=1 Tax=Crinalium epipsammum PCC 9333 TaxID=1173022 RepID=K9W4Q1_9CYAN|nr:proton extrusion protein PcxA [Crinalium epipsammum]AFZ14717.1 envelope membrane protein [Crinalium epipsammum PCC 9333]
MRATFSWDNTDELRKKVGKYLRATNKWFFETPERSLEQAYNAALIIRSIEEEYLGDRNSNPAEQGKNVKAYLKADIDKNLGIIKLRLAEFKLSRSILTISNPVILEKLRFIDEVLVKYQQKNSNSVALIPVTEASPITLQPDKIKADQHGIDSKKFEKPTEKTGALPRSIGRTLNRIKTELDPESETAVVRDFRKSRNRTKVTIRFILLLILIPVLTQQLSKEFLVKPIIAHVKTENNPQIFLNVEMQEEAFRELENFEASLKFQNLINQAPKFSSEEMEERVKNKAIKIAEEFRDKSRDAVSNIFADFLGLAAFGVVIATSKREIVTVKFFMDEIVYGLSDSAKAFIIILCTDIFVGFHSPHGWEVILEGFAGHLGLAANQSLISLFIATVPVILDTFFKYWIFRYLSRVSPSAVATLRNMNE